MDQVMRLAQSGDVCMQNILGRYYYPSGQNPLPYGAKPHDFDPREAAKWYRLAAERAHGDAQASLASLYWSGEGVRQDFVEATRWSRRAADQGLSCPQLQLGEMYRDAIGAPKDYVQGHMWMNIAASGESWSGCVKRAKKERDTIALKMTPAQIDEAHSLAREWLPNISRDPDGPRTYRKDGT
jgi:TPR repeat protein